MEQSVSDAQQQQLNHNNTNTTEEYLVQDDFINKQQEQEISIFHEKQKRIGIKFFLLFMLNGFLNVIITVIQIIYTSKTQNVIYLIGCFMFGPLHVIAVLLAVSINFCSKLKTKESLALWSIRVLLLGFIPFIIIAALNSLFIIECAETRLVENCELLVYNVSILAIAIVCIFLDSFFYLIYNIHF